MFYLFPGIHSHCATLVKHTEIPQKVMLTLVNWPAQAISPGGSLVKKLMAQ